MSHEQQASLTDETLLARTSAGDANAFSALVQRHGGAVLRYLRSVAGSDRGVEDAAQDALIDLWTHADRVRTGAVRAWLFTAARRRLFRGQRGGGAEPVDDADLAVLADAAGFGAEPGPEVQLAAAQEIAHLRLALDRLAPPYREAIVLVDLEGLSYEEAAEVVSASVPSVRSRLHRARLSLAAALRAEVLS